MTGIAPARPRRRAPQGAGQVRPPLIDWNAKRIRARAPAGR